MLLPAFCARSWRLRLYVALRSVCIRLAGGASAAWPPCMNIAWRGSRTSSGDGTRPDARVSSSTPWHDVVESQKNGNCFARSDERTRSASPPEGASMPIGLLRVDRRHAAADETTVERMHAEVPGSRNTMARAFAQRQQRGRDSGTDWSDRHAGDDQSGEAAAVGEVGRDAIVERSRRLCRQHARLIAPIRRIVWWVCA